jgi:hypothetical protein
MSDGSTGAGRNSPTPSVCFCVSGSAANRTFTPGFFILVISASETEQTVWEVFEEERPKLVAYRGRFDGFHALPASVSKTFLVRFDNNKILVNASAVGRPVEIHAYADRIVIRPDGRLVAEHRRSYSRGETKEMDGLL